VGDFYPLFFLEDTRLIKDFLVNEKITEREVRVITDEGTQLGVMPIREALAAAADREMDLVLIAPAAKPPVCRICDFGKFQYQQIKKEKEAKKNQKVTDVKNMELSPNIDVGDLQIKARKVIEFLKDGCVVKIGIKLRGRQLGRPENSLRTMQEFWELVAEYANMDRSPLQEGRNISMTISPKK
jgi:translation initiation factor IF-3